MSMLATVPTCQSTFHSFSKGGHFSTSFAFVGASLATSTFVVLSFTFSNGASLAASFHLSFSFPVPAQGGPFSTSLLSFSFSPHRTDLHGCWAICSFAHISHMSTLVVLHDHSSNGVIRAQCSHVQPQVLLQWSSRFVQQRCNQY